MRAATRALVRRVALVGVLLSLPLLLLHYPVGYSILLGLWALGAGAGIVYYQASRRRTRQVSQVLAVETVLHKHASALPAIFALSQTPGVLQWLVHRLGEDGAEIAQALAAEFDGSLDELVHCSQALREP